MDLEVDEATLLRAYSLETLEPTSFYNFDHIDEDSTSAAQSAGSSAHEEPDPLGLHSRIPTRQYPKDLRSQISVSSKAFDPKVFLSTIHPDATFADLSHGLNQLKDNIEQRSHALKVLVEDNFDRFVAVKATTDGVYREMKESEGGPLRPESDYGVGELRKILGQASARADQVFTPVLENNLKAMKLRSTLGVFERSKFFFNLPGSLADSVEAGKYEVALRDYEKGKYLLENRPAQLLAFNTGQSGDPRAQQGTDKQRQQQERVFRKVWDAVEDTMQGMQRKLFASLRKPKRPVEEHEKTIEILLELSPKEDPVAAFLESQHKHIQTLMRTSYESSRRKVDTSKTMNDLLPRTEKDKARDIQSCLRQVGRGDPDFERSFGASSWQTFVQLVRTVSENLTSTLPGFWKVCKNHADGKFPKSTAPGIQNRARAWAHESIESYVQLLSSFFTLTDVSILARQPLSKVPAWVPANTCCMTAAHYMHMILQDLSDTVTTLTAMDIGHSPATLKSFMTNARFMFTEVLCNLWQSDAKIFYMLEDWTINPDEQSTTLFLKELSSFHRSNAKAAYHIASGRSRDPFDSSVNRSRDTGVSSEFTSRIKSAFLDALYAYLDGIVHLAFSEYDPLHPTLSTSHKVVGNSRLTVDVQELDTRILLSVTNLSHLNRIAIPTMAKQFQEVYHCKMSDDLGTIDEVSSQLDKILFEDFLKRKSETVCNVFRQGILQGKIDWKTQERPKGVQPFIYEALLALVQVHCQVSSIAKSLINRTITTLLEQLTSVIYDSFLKIPKFSLGGMLQATLEIEFIHQTLSFYISSTAEHTLKQIYQVISDKYAGQEEEEGLQRELQGVKKILIASRKATALEFLCFRRSTGSKSAGTLSTVASNATASEQKSQNSTTTTTTTTTRRSEESRERSHR
ncbi:unnamed protein product [Sympodiomycopsis kandeliae]